MLAREGLAFELVGDEHVRPAGLGDGEALGVGAVERHEPDRARVGVHPGPVEDVPEPHPGPADLGHPPARHTLEVAGDVGLGHRREVVEREDGPVVDEALHGQQVGGHAVDPEPADRQQGQQAGRVLGEHRADVALEPALDVGPEDDADRSEPQESEEHPSPDRRVARGGSQRVVRRLEPDGDAAGRRP